MLGFVTLSAASKISIRYEKPSSAKYEEIYHTLKSNNRQILGESARYLNELYHWRNNIRVVVASCGFVNSRYEPPGIIIICYESLYQKIYDYPNKAASNEEWLRRVFQNTMFTFWHEIGHVILDQLGWVTDFDTTQIELYADEFAVLSMLWRSDSKWKDVVMISALHFKRKSQLNAGKTYENHPDDRRRYEKMITLLYGFSQKSYSRLSNDVNQIQWLNKSAQAYYFERSAIWEKYLREHTRTDFFDN